MFSNIVAASSSGGNAVVGGIIFFACIFVFVGVVAVFASPSLRHKVMSSTRTASKATVGPKPRSKWGKRLIG